MLILCLTLRTYHSLYGHLKSSPTTKNDSPSSWTLVMLYSANGTSSSYFNKFYFQGQSHAIWYRTLFPETVRFTERQQLLQWIMKSRKNKQYKQYWMKKKVHWSWKISMSLWKQILKRCGWINGYVFLSLFLYNGKSNSANTHAPICFYL